jgi:putative transposase
MTIQLLPHRLRDRCRWVRSVKEECLPNGNHQGKGNVLLFPRSGNRCRDGHVQCRERLAGLLRYYHQEAA